MERGGCQGQFTASRNTLLQSERQNTSVNLDYGYTGLHRSIRLCEVDANRLPDNRQVCQPHASVIFTPKTFLVLICYRLS